MKKALILLAAAIACVSFAAQQPQPDERFDRAYDAWCAGDYIPALEGFESLLRGPDAERYFERIALITGELYVVTELAPDGRNVRFSPSGRHAAFETGSRTAARTNIISVVQGTRTVAEIPGSSLVFSPAAHVVSYLRVREIPEISSQRQEVEKLNAQPAPDRQKLAQLQRELSALELRNSEIVMRDLASGQERRLEDDGLLKAALAFSADGREIYFVGAAESDTAANQIYAVSDSSKPRALTSGPGFKTGPIAVPGGKYLIYTAASQSPFPRPGAAGPAGRPGPGAQAPRQFAVVNLADGTTIPFNGSAPVVTSDGSALAFVSQTGSESAIQYVRLGGPLQPSTIKKSSERISSAAFSPDGSRLVFDMMHTRNMEIFCIKSDGAGEVRLSREIQHDRAPRFINATQVLAVKGEPRHSRSYLYDTETMAATKLFHNNTVRTIAPEYEWAANPAGTLVLIQAERDGDTISPERGVYLLNLSRKITRSALLDRVQANLSSERELRALGEAHFRPIAPQVKSVVDRVSIVKLYEYQEALFNFDSKHISQPGNKQAGDYIFSAFKSFGYEPEYQWFTSREIRTANILATLHGTENPELIYVLSAHYDSNQRGPGADDNSSATAVLLETARVMAKTPMPATIIFAAFTGEEAGLLGSREFVRQAVGKKLQVVGALNNDMIGWTNDYRLDNTIRYSNAGIRDLQHAAAFLFSKMITYDARYFRSTDAAAYYEVYGDIVGGFGSYPVLGNPYYHQPTDLLETVNHQLLVEATKANAASIMILAVSPSRVTDLKAASATDGYVELSWTPNPEKNITGYTVAYGPAGNPMASTITVKQPRARLTAPKLKDGERLQIAVRAINSRGLVGWDWARTALEAGRRN